VAIAALVMTLITFIGAEVAPKTYAVQHTDRAALAIAPFVYVLTRLPVLGPLTRLLIGIGNVVTPGKGLKSGPFVSEDEIKAMVDEAERDEVIEEEEREMIHSIFEFGDTILREVMVPRPDMVAVPLETSLAAGAGADPAHRLLPHPRLRRHRRRGRRPRLRQGRAPAPARRPGRQAPGRHPAPGPFMPESMRAADCLREMRKRKSHMVIVIDEYGGTSAWSPWRTCWRRSSGRSPTSTTGRSPTSSPCPTATTGSTPASDVDEVNELLDVSCPRPSGTRSAGCCSTWSAGCPARARRSSSRGCGCGPSGSRAGASAGPHPPAAPPEEPEDVTAQARRQ
jgi:hypothetical protein